MVFYLCNPETKFAFHKFGTLFKPLGMEDVLYKCRRFNSMEEAERAKRKLPGFQSSLKEGDWRVVTLSELRELFDFNKRV